MRMFLVTNCDADRLRDVVAGFAIKADAEAWIQYWRDRWRQSWREGGNADHDYDDDLELMEAEVFVAGPSEAACEDLLRSIQINRHNVRTRLRAALGIDTTHKQKSENADPT